MNKVLFLISATVLVACSGGSIQTSVAIKAGDTDMKAGDCQHFSGGFFGFGGDFPLSVTAGEATVKGGEDLETGHYQVKQEGTEVVVSESEEACEEAEEEEKEDSKADTTTEKEPIINDGTPDDTPVGPNE